ncbi:MAG TPA: hypothetical protein VK166_15790 [Chitinophagaceae bacterium]|nr:hypothetical protein [Chitinophagaceae bacterium]
MKNILLIIVLIATPTAWAISQGCVAVRNIAGVSPELLLENIKPGDKLVLNVTNRYFEASDSYVGDKFITDTLVTNRIYTLNFSLLILLNKGWSLGVIVPVAANSRNNGADHKGPKTLPRYTTRAFGLGDIRLSVYKWLLDPVTHAKGNIQLGLGIELPTGDYRYEDYFVRNDSVKVLAPVDQAIQLGDGGTGITAELSAFYKFNKVLKSYFQGFYMSNPREQNGVSNLKGRQPTPTQIKNSTTVMSVPDFYSVRGGASVQVKNTELAAGLRFEKVPENDLIGGNRGFRRAASISSVDLGLSQKFKNTLVFVNAGLPFKNNIVINEQNDMTPAGFAKVLFYFGAQFVL